MPHRKKASNEEIIKLYNDGFSCESIEEMFSMTRQAVHERLKRNKVLMRTKTVLPYIIYDNIKFTPSGSGYYRATSREKHISLHIYKYEKEVGKIPHNFDIHHKDGNKQNNDIKNLECISKSEHTRKYPPSHNQYKNYRTMNGEK